MSKISRRSLLRNSAALVAAASVRVSDLEAQRPAQAASAPDTEWRNYANDLASTRYSPLDQINASNFNNLEVAWSYSTNALGPRPDTYFNATPLAANGRLLTTAGTRRDVVALDPETGELLWMYRKDEGQRAGTRPGTGWGLSYWTDGTQERVIYVTVGYQMISLDAKTGIPDPAFGKNGVVDLREDDDQTMDMARGIIGLHATPLVVRNTVVVGCAPSASVKGYVRGYDVKSGKRKWIFHTVPRKGEFGYETWIKADQAEGVGNIGSWAQASADPDLGLVYIGVELPQGDQVGTARVGSALFGESVVALDIETGVRKWHYQMIHHGLWDSDVPCASILCDIPVNGRTVKALAQPTKQSFLYVLNRETGEPIWPIPEMPVPQGDVPGEWYSPTQPMPTKPPAFDQQGCTEDTLVDFTPEIKARALEIARHHRLGPLYTPPVLTKEEGPWSTITLPGSQGGANWPGGSYDPETHMVYVYSKTVAEKSGIGPNADGTAYLRSQGGMTRGTADQGGGGFGSVGGRGGPIAAELGIVGGGGRGGGRGGFGQVNDNLDAPIIPNVFSVAGLPINKPPYGRITAIDLKNGTLAWQVAHGETPDAIANHPLLKGRKIPGTGQAGILGTLTTKTLVICGDAGVFTDDKGRKGARLRAYDKATGEEKGAVFMPKMQSGAAMTYMYRGRQYIVSAISGTGGGELIAYRLPATR